MIVRRQSKNDMDEDFEEYMEEEYEDDFEIEPPMHAIKDERDRTFTRRGFEKKVVDFSKQHSGFGQKKGLPVRTKTGPMNRTRGRSPFTYSRGLQLHRKRSEVEDCDCEEKPKRMSWGVPWKRVVRENKTNYSCGLQLHRVRSEEVEDEAYPRKRMSWGVPWKRVVRESLPN